MLSSVYRLGREGEGGGAVSGGDGGGAHLTVLYEKKKRSVRTALATQTNETE